MNELNEYCLEFEAINVLNKRLEDRRYVIEKSATKLRAALLGSENEDDIEFLQELDEFISKCQKKAISLYNTENSKILVNN